MREPTAVHPSTRSPSTTDQLAQQMLLGTEIGLPPLMPMAQGINLAGGLSNTSKKSLLLFMRGSFSFRDSKQHDDIAVSQILLGGIR